MMMTINSTLDSETATMIAREFGADVQMRTFEEEMVDVEAERQQARGPRAARARRHRHGPRRPRQDVAARRDPRDARSPSAKPAASRSTSARTTSTSATGSIVFLDTPGHEAFTMMRARGAKVTDIVVLVVAADDGVMPQTREAIDHAKAANVPIVVAVNKIDKPGANPDSVKRELADLGLMPEDWGGTTVTVDVSAKKRQNLDQLLEMILLVVGHRSSSRPTRRRAPWARCSKPSSIAAAARSRRSSCRTARCSVGDIFIAGSMVGKVRALIDDRGRPIKQAGPSTPVEVLGLTGLPQPGDTFQAVADPAKARQIALFRQEQAKDKALGAKGGASRSSRSSSRSPKAA